MAGCADERPVVENPEVEAPKETDLKLKRMMFDVWMDRQTRLGTLSESRRGGVA